ncbi:MAG: discoidin domain-containing protein [Kiritimatiellia bacterium]
MKQKNIALNLFVCIFLAGCWTLSVSAVPKQISGIYPHLTMYNKEGECGTGAVVPWADRLWVITYGPHLPRGSSDKLYEITADLEQIIRPESVGGTPANRMIHRESNQLNIGPYLIDADRNVRVLDPEKMPGRLTGTARHLSDPENKIHIATMEEGLYSVNVHTLGIEEHIRDGNGQLAVQNGIPSKLPGYHGKGLYSGQGVLIYANNGTRGKFATIRPDIPSGALACWKGSGDWEMIRRNQFTEVSGPGGIYGNEDPEKDPVWSMGWDYRSLILMLLDKGKWHACRLPKGSHSYDGAHGWNTEWPRIRDVGEQELLATMHGTFWRFPKTFSFKNSAGIKPRSSYLKVIGDFARWNDQIVFGCDDSAQKEFLNSRPFKSSKGAPVQSNSNLWFVEPERIDRLGSAIGRGSVWLHDDLKAGAVSDPYMFSGYDYRMMVIRHDNPEPVNFTLEIDRKGDGQWSRLKTFKVDKSQIHVFAESEKGAWVRVSVDTDVKAACVHFNYRNKDKRGNQNGAVFDSVAGIGEVQDSKGVIRSNRKVLSMLAGGKYYELNDKLELAAGKSRGAALVAQGAQPDSRIRVDAASVIVEEDGRTYRIPKNPAYEEANTVAEGHDLGGGVQSSPRLRSTSTDPALQKEKPRVSLEDYLPQSLSKGAAVAVSSTYKEFKAKNIVDGRFDEDSRWIAEGEGSWLTVDMGAPKTFRSVCIATGWKRESQYASKNFDVQVKQENNWVTLPGGAVRGNGSIVVVVNFDKAVTAQELKIDFKDGGYNRIYEVAVLEDQPDISSNDSAKLQFARVCREIATERDLFNFHGTFYELPARNAQGFAKIRPVATHNLQIHDYASHFGMLFFTGLNGIESERVIKSKDGRTALWAGVVDDLWQLGKPRGEGGVWNKTAVKAGVPSDPYLMTGYDRKSVTLSADNNADITLEIDIDGTEVWVPYKTFAIKAGSALTHEFPVGFSAYWVRAVSSADTKATVMFRYD